MLDKTAKIEQAFYSAGLVGDDGAFKWLATSEQLLDVVRGANHFDSEYDNLFNTMNVAAIVDKKSASKSRLEHLFDARVGSERVLKTGAQPTNQKRNGKYRGAAEVSR